MTFDVEKFYIDFTDRAIYDKLEKEFPKKFTKKDLFMFALITGYKSKIRIPLEKRQEFFWASNLKPEDEIIIKSIAVTENENIDILQDNEKLIGIAQDYARGGISIIKKTLEQHGSFVKYIEKEISDKSEEHGWT